MFQKRIPTILGFLLLIVGLLVGLYAVQTVQKLTSQATPGTAPDNVRITNISDQSFTVSWVTEKDTTGFISYGTTPKLGQTVFDNRAGNDPKYTSAIHYVTLKGLQADTKYLFKIGSGKTLFDDQGQSYSQQTAAVSTSPPPVADPIYGSINTSGGNPLGGAIVYLSVKGTALSALTKSDGNWLIPINNARSRDGKNYLSLNPEGEKLEIFVQGGSQGTATATTDSSNTQPVPVIALGKQNLAFGAKERIMEVPLESTVSATPSATPPSASASATISVQITDNEIISNPQPTFKGTGVPNTTIVVKVESTPQTAIVNVASDGTWQWTPPIPLSDGPHTLTLTPQGGQPIVRSFEISSLAYEPSPSISTPSGAPMPIGGLPDAGGPLETLLLLGLGFTLIISGGLGLVKTRKGFTRW